MWRRKIVHARREEYKSELDEKLFALDEVFGGILMEHRRECVKMEKELRVVDMKPNGVEIWELGQFLGRQAAARDAATRVIEEKSRQCRLRFKEGIDRTLEKLRSKETEPEDDAARADFKTETHQPKQIVNTNPTLEALGFKHSLKYGPRSELRKACTRFLRFSYLLDFLSTEALTNIYLHSVEETINKLRDLSQIPVNLRFNSQKSFVDQPKYKTSSDHIRQKDEKNKSESMGTATTRMLANQYPFFEVQGIFVERPIPEDHKETVEIKPYEPPPLGTSDKLDFNPLVHLEIEEEEASEHSSDEKEFVLQDDLHRQNTNLFMHQGVKVKGLCRLWLKAEPDGDRFSQELSKCLVEGMQCLKVY